MSARRIRNSRTFYTARVALTTLLALAMTFGSVPTCALQALAEDAEEVAVTLAAPEGDAGADAAGLEDEAAAEPTDEGGTEDEAAEDAAAEDEPEEAPAGEEAYVEETEASEPEAEGDGAAEETLTEAEDAESEPAIFEAETDDVRVRLTVAAEAELPEDVYLVVTTLRGDVEDEAPTVVAAIDVDEPTTGADAALEALTEAVQARANKDAKKAGEQVAELAVADAYVVELVNEDGNVVAVDEDQAELEVTFANEDALEDYDGLYTVEREDAKADEAEASVYATADEEYADADDATEALDYSGEAEDVSDELLEDIETGEISLELEGVAAVVGVKAAGGPRKVTKPNPETRSTIDTNKLGITMNLFDYVAVDALTNSYNKDDFGNGTRSGINEGKDKANQLKFYATGDGLNTTWNQAENGTNPGNGINQFTGVGPRGENKYNLQFANQGIVQSTLSSDGYPLLNTKASDKTLNYLFDPSSTYDSDTKRKSYEKVNKLFYLENQGTVSERMVYDSNESYAYYDTNQGDKGDFKVYNGTYNRADNGTSLPIGFFPFNDWASRNAPVINPNNSGFDASKINHHLGMTLNTPFIMPYNGRIHDTKTGQEAPLIFEFSGDDDMWVFVDNKLVLDIGGIHQPVSGTINFETGVVTISYGTPDAPNNGNQGTHYSYPADGIEDKNVLGDKAYLWNVYASGSLVNDGSGIRHPGILGDRDSAKNEGGSNHVLQAFYLERGGCDSNLMISTNIHLMAKKKAEVYKEWQPDLEESERASKSVEVELVRKGINRSVANDVRYDVVATATLNAQQVETIAADGTTRPWYAGWKDLPSEGYVKYTQAEDGTKTYPITPADNVEYQYELNANDSKLYCDFEYFVREKSSVDGYTTSYQRYDETAQEFVNLKAKEYEYNGVELVGVKVLGVKVNNSPIKLINHHNYLDVKKIWLNENGEATATESDKHANDTVYVQLYKQVLSSDGSTWLPADGETIGSYAALTSAKDQTTGEKWTHRFEILDTGANVRYLVKEGTLEGDVFVASDVLSTRSAGLYEQKSIEYFRSQTLYNNAALDNDGTLTKTLSVDNGASSKNTKAYYWGDPKDTGADGAHNWELKRTFDGRTATINGGEGEAAAAQTSDTVEVPILVSKAASLIPDGNADDLHEYDLVVTLAASGGIVMNPTPTLNGANVAYPADSNGVVTVTIPAAKAKAAAGSVLTLNVPVAKQDGGNLAEVTSAAPGKIAVQQTEYHLTRYPESFTVGELKSAGSNGVSLSQYGTARAEIKNGPVRTKVTVEKVWTDGADNHSSDPVYVQLYKDGTAVGDAVELKASSDTNNNWKYTWTNLDPTGEYTVLEGTMSGDDFAEATKFIFNDKAYSQQSIKYYDKDDNELTASKLDGTVIPNAGKVVITNGPLSAKIKLKKVDADSPTTTIKGATFVLLKDSGNSAGTGVGTYGPEDTTRVPNADATFTTGDDGTVELPGLDPGTYWLQETSAPEGYLLHDQNHPICIKVKDDCEVELELEDDTYNTGKLLPTRSEKDANDVYTITVRNLRVYALPSTGGVGVFPFLAVGAFVAALAVGEADDRRLCAVRRAVATGARGTRGRLR